MASKTGGGRGWFIEYRAEEQTRPSDFLWPTQIVDDQAVTSIVAGFDVVNKEASNPDAGSKKRNRAESSAEPGTKACREKQRRDMLNDRFFELSSLLDPGKVPMPDKFDILSDATRRLNQLRHEVQTLKKSNEALQEGIKEVKAEKVELRDKKLRLKSDKERLEQILKGMSAPSPYVPHVAATAPYHPATFAGFSKTVPYPNQAPVTMWQWIPPAVLDTSKDHVLRPPVA